MSLTHAIDNIYVLKKTISQIPNVVIPNAVRNLKSSSANLFATLDFSLRSK